MASAAAAARLSSALKPPHRIKVNGHHIHLRFLQQLLWTVITVSLLEAVVAALYYLLFETRYGPVYLKPGWDGMFAAGWWPVYRHGLRDVGEGVLANLGIRSLITKWQKNYGERLTDSRLAFRAILAFVTAFALIILGIWAVNYALPDAWHHIAFLRHHVITSPVHSGTLSNAGSGFKWQDFIVGFVITHIIRAMWSPIGNTINAAFIDRRVAAAHGRTPLWVKYPLAPPTIRERFAWTQETHPDITPKRDLATRVLMVIVILCVPLAGYGEYVLHVIAKGS